MTLPPAAPSRSSVCERLLRSRLAWMVVAAIVFLSFLGRTPITTDHERRVAETAATMAKAGWPWADVSLLVQRSPGDVGAVALNPWLVPVFDGQIRLQKPPLPYWAAAIVHKIAGEGPGSARLVPALLGVVSTLLVYRLGRRVGGRNVGLVAMFAWTSTHFVVDEYRKAMADPYLAALVLAATVAWVESTFVACRRRGGALILAFWAILGVACIAKGPVVFLHAILAIGTFSYCFRRWPRANLLWHVGGIALWAAISLPWPAYVVMRVPGAIELWRTELDRDRNPRPFWFYLHSPFLMSVPWTYAWIASIVLAIQLRSRRLAFAHLWLLATLVVFSFAHMKKNAYLLPVSPAIAIAAAQAAVKGIAFARLRRKPHQVRLVAFGHTIVGVVFAIVIGVLTFKQRAPGTTATAIAVTAAALLVASLPLLVRPERAFARWLGVQAFAFATLVMLFIAFPESQKKVLSRDARRAATTQTIQMTPPEASTGP